tara:strand:- start:4646 stop:5218 length:573 start_codon:yes stop_codon:yes gene_type:complete
VKWKDILKEVITQGKIKEIEDIDIDIEDDDCLRWLNKLYSIITRYPEGKMVNDEIRKEEQACYVKNKWEDKEDLMFRNSPNFASRIRRFISEKSSPYRKGGAWVSFSFFNREGTNYVFGDSNATYRVTLLSVCLESFDSEEYDDGVRNFGKEIEKYARFDTDDKEKVIKVIKEICNYLNLDYNGMLEEII